MPEQLYGGKITWNRVMKEQAKERGLALFALGVEGKTGGAKIHTWVPHEITDKLTVFALALASQTKTPHEAFQMAFEGDDKPTDK